VQHLDGSIIKELRVKEGDRLATGDVLVVLDDMQTRAEHHMPWQQFLVPQGTENGSGWSLLSSLTSMRPKA
jgi:epimerase transport system membrane fusion protein